MVDVKLFALGEDWREIVARETAEFKLESEGGLDVTKRVLPSMIRLRQCLAKRSRRDHRQRPG